jgi:hypothetical protein
LVEDRKTATIAPMSALGPDDDRLHPGGGDPTWAETCWFAAQVPERRLGIWTYPLFRSELGVMSCAIYIWGPDARELWQQPYYRYYWHQPIPEGLDLRDFEIEAGLAYKMIEPLTTYEVRYRDEGAVDLSMRFEAIQPAQPLGVEDGHGHIDQLGRVTGTLVLHGEEIAIDCIEMRDRTWSPRRERRERTRLGYSYGAVDEGTAFLQASAFREDGTQRALGGYRIVAPGTQRELHDLRREVERDPEGRPVRVHVSSTDDAGEPFEATGEVVSQMAMNTSPYFVWVSQVRWQLPDGRIAWGEDQDTWSPGRLRRDLPDLLGK